MADPTNPTGAAPAAAQPKVKTEIEKRYDAAGYARNRAEFNYNKAVKDHGADSAEAKAAKETLDAAQAEVLKIQKEMSGGKKVAQKPAAPKKEEPKPAPAEAPKAPGATIVRKFAPLPIIRYSEYIEMRPKATLIYERSSEMLIHPFPKLLNDKAVKDFVECLKKNKDQKDGISPCLDKLDGKKPAVPNPLQLKTLTIT